MLPPARTPTSGNASRSAQPMCIRDRGKNKKVNTQKNLRPSPVSDLEIIAWIAGLVQDYSRAHSVPVEVLAYLRNEERAATRLVVKRISTDSWEVGRSNRPTQFT